MLIKMIKYFSRFRYWGKNKKYNVTAHQLSINTRRLTSLLGKEYFTFITEFIMTLYTRISFGNLPLRRSKK